MIFLTEQNQNMQCHWTVGQNIFDCGFIALKYGPSLWRKKKRMKTSEENTYFKNKGSNMRENNLWVISSS